MAQPLNCATGAGVAQLVEQRIRNAWVGGSIPFSGTSFNEIMMFALRTITPPLPHAGEGNG